MAKRIEGPYDFSPYNFSTYADGATWELTHGEDFNVTPSTLTGVARKWALAEGLDIEYKYINGNQAEPPRVALRFRKASAKRAS